MLRFEEIRKTPTMSFLVISNENGRVEIPVEPLIGDRISKYLGKIVSGISVEPGLRNNIEDSE